MPITVTAPRVGRSKPTHVLIRVDLPAAFGPTRAVMPPGREVQVDALPAPTCRADSAWHRPRVLSTGIGIPFMACTGRPAGERANQDRQGHERERHGRWREAVCIGLTSFGESLAAQRAPPSGTSRCWVACFRVLDAADPSATVRPCRSSRHDLPPCSSRWAPAGLPGGLGLWPGQHRHDAGGRARAGPWHDVTPDGNARTRGVQPHHAAPGPHDRGRRR